MGTELASGLPVIGSRFCPVMTLEASMNCFQAIGNHRIIHVSKYFIDLDIDIIFWGVCELSFMCDRVRTRADVTAAVWALPWCCYCFSEVQVILLKVIKD
jgi:hypothetical protein